MGKYLHGKPDSKISLESVKERVQELHLSTAKTAYIALLYWIGCRRSEPMFIKKEDIEETDGSLYVTIPALKGGSRGGAIKLPLERWGIPELRKAWKKARKGRQVIPFHSKTGYRIVKKLFPKKTPHWFRHTLVTKLREKRDKGEITTDQIKSYTGIQQDATIERYGMKTHAGIEKIVEVLE